VAEQAWASKRCGRDVTRVISSLAITSFKWMGGFVPRTKSASEDLAAIFKLSTD
jgi:hypothetical protein